MAPELKVSHPVWVRGLKLIYVRCDFFKVTVAPRVGAWIETDKERLYQALEKSHPVWVRGLKPSSIISSLANPCVAPRVGAWIETHERM